MTVPSPLPDWRTQSPLDEPGCTTKETDNQALTDEETYDLWTREAVSSGREAVMLSQAAPNAIDFCTPASMVEGESMDLFDMFAGAESFHTRRLLEQARGLTDAQLNQPLHNPAHVSLGQPSAEPAEPAAPTRRDERSLGHDA